VRLIYESKVIVMTEARFLMVLDLNCACSLGMDSAGLARMKSLGRMMEWM
jgi:hypothetical protein